MTRANQRNKGRTKSRQTAGTKKLTTPRTAEQFFAKPERVQETLRHVTDVIAKMRKGLSLRAAAREAGTSPRTVLRRAGSVIRRGSNGRYAAKPGDQLLRVLKIPTPDGLREIGVRGSRQASTLGKYAAAVQTYLSTGNFAPLSKFTGISIRDDQGNLVPFLTDRATLNRLGSAGAISYESIYARV